MAPTATAVPTVDECLTNAVHRINLNTSSWKGFEGVFEFCLRTDNGGDRVTHLAISPEGASWGEGPAPVMPGVRLSLSEKDFVRLTLNIVDEELLHRRGLLEIEGDMFLVHKLPSLLLSDTPLYQFAATR